MTPEKIREVIAIYRVGFEQLGALDSSLAHCHRMLDQMETFITEGRMDKVYRWLGFIQGVLWSKQVYTLTELKNHNRPTP